MNASSQISCVEFCVRGSFLVETGWFGSQVTFRKGGLSTFSAHRFEVEGVGRSSGSQGFEAS
jgi:hypothetical protein